jgi:putative two-component system response regulator
MTETRRIIMLVDDNMTNLVAGRNLLKDRYHLYPLPSASKLFEFLNRIRPDLILLDIEMPEMNGYEALQKLKADETTTGIPVIFLTSTPGEEEEWFRLGAAGYVEKPFEAPFLIDCIEKNLTKKNLSKMNLAG